MADGSGRARQPETTAAAGGAGPGRARPAPAGSLLRRILVINAVGLGVLLGGVLYLNQFRAGLIELRADALRTQGEIIAIAVAEAASSGDAVLGFDQRRANLVLRRLAQPAGARSRIYDRAGRLAGDTRIFDPSGGTIEAHPLPPPGRAPRRGWAEWLADRYGDAVTLLKGAPALYRETPIAGVASEDEVYAALAGETVVATRANSEGETIVSVALPIQRFKAVLGALVISTEGGDIDRIVEAERMAILRVAAVAAAVSAALSALLASTIARPLRRLAEAAARSGALDRRPVDPRQVNFPDYTRRGDEIGYLSGALREMTAALYARLDAIERFAADVAHEIKNPLTSLRSAVETLRRAPDGDARDRLMAVIEHDVRRLDRLVTDISNASRLDAELAREAMEPVDVGALLETVAAIGAARAETRGATIRAPAPAERLVVRGLETRLGQVFLNLLDNALSFSPRGGVVELRAIRGPGGARITVEDEGPGVPEHNLERIFERFHSERPADEGFGDHSGLGLSISRQIVEAHGGRIWAENRAADGAGAPRGARFVVELPA
jgi:two-component system sensor histidine kinase ChvG